MKNAQSPNIKLRLIALIKLLRGFAALVFGITLFSLYKDNTSISAFLSDPNILRLKGTELFWVLSQILPFIEQYIVVLIMIMFMITAIRFFEAFGLWFERRWGEWLALITTLIYLPLEVMMLRGGFRPFPVVILIVNLLISYYLFSLLRKSKR